MVTVTCHWKGCGKHFQARQADINRGWGKFCSKRCKAMEQECRTGQNRERFTQSPHPTLQASSTVRAFVDRTDHLRRMLERKDYRPALSGDPVEDEEILRGLDLD